MPRLTLLLLLQACTTTTPTTPTLHLPLDCTPATDCWISSRPDTDPGPSATDHAGSTHTYDGHGGTDFAPRHAGQAEATWVLAPADGVVTGVRDGLHNGSLLAGHDFGDQDCGNGVALDLGDDWWVQLCHLWPGSVGEAQIAVGDRVTRGQRLGRVGWSGRADHPHVHLSVRHQDQPVDPFTGRALHDGSPRASGPLWATPLPDPGELPALAWIGLRPGPVPDEPWPLDGGVAVLPPTTTTLTLQVFLWHPQVGDRVQSALVRPDGTTTTAEVVQDRARPRQTWSVDKTWDPAEPPTGLWTATVRWTRGDLDRTLTTSALLPPAAP